MSYGLLFTMHLILQIYKYFSRCINIIKIWHGVITIMLSAETCFFSDASKVNKVNQTNKIICTYIVKIKQN